MVNRTISVGLLGFALFVLVPAAPAHGQTADQAEFRADVRKLLDATNASQLATQMGGLMSQGILNTVRQMQTDIPERALIIVKEVVDSEMAKAMAGPERMAGPESLLEQITTIYMKHLTHDDVKGLLAFYSSDLGKKTMALLPVLMSEGAVAGQEWAAKESPRIMLALETRLRAEGLLKQVK